MTAFPPAESGKYKVPFCRDIQIIPYHPSLAPWFKKLNMEWLEHYYYVTEEDLLILDHPEKIIASGGEILFAKYKDEIIGTAALNKISDQVVELIKMGVSAHMQGFGAGKKLLDAIISLAVKMKFEKIILETATPLNAAISLYKKSGFIQTSGEELHPVFGRITFKMEKNLTQTMQ